MKVKLVAIEEALLVEPETELEQYALEMWRVNFNRGMYTSKLKINGEPTEPPEE